MFATRPVVTCKHCGRKTSGGTFCWECNTSGARNLPQHQAPSPKSGHFVVVSNVGWFSQLTTPTMSLEQAERTAKDWTEVTGDTAQVFDTFGECVAKFGEGVGVPSASEREES